MKTTVDIPKEALEEVMRHTGARTKREAVLAAIDEFNRRRRLARLVDRLGSFEELPTLKEVLGLRGEG